MTGTMNGPVMFETHQVHPDFPALHFDLEMMAENL
jgi:hypothetical protein